ncbi:MAG: hypothetical protein R3F43_15760 [bacterium]
MLARAERRRATAGIDPAVPGIRGSSGRLALGDRAFHRKLFDRLRPGTRATRAGPGRSTAAPASTCLMATPRPRSSSRWTGSRERSSRSGARPPCARCSGGEGPV